MRNFLFIAILFLSCGVAPAQSAQPFPPLQTSRQEKRAPRLQPPQSSPECEDAVAENGATFVRCSGENVRLHVAVDTPLHLVLDSYLLTRGLNNATITRSLMLQSPIESRYLGRYADRDTPILTYITGHSGGPKSRAWIQLEPMLIKLSVGPTDYIAFDTKDNRPMYLKPGIWELNFDTSIRQIATPDGQSWTRKDNDEENKITNGRFGLERSTQPTGDILNGLSSLPGGAAVYAVSQLRDLWRFLTHRPNMTLPPGTDLYFQINAIRANYIGPPPPAGVGITK